MNFIQGALVTKEVFKTALKKYGISGMRAGILAWVLT